MWKNRNILKNSCIIESSYKCIIINDSFSLPSNRKCFIRVLTWQLSLLYHSFPPDECNYDPKIVHDQKWLYYEYQNLKKKLWRRFYHVIQFKIAIKSWKARERLYTYDFIKIIFPTCVKNVRFRLKQITTGRVFNQNILSSTTPKNLSKLLKNVKSCYEKILVIFYQKSLLSDRKYLITSKFRPKFQKFIWWNFCHFLVKIFGKIFRWKFHKKIWKISLEFETVLDKVEFLFTSVLNLVHPI